MGSVPSRAISYPLHTAARQNDMTAARQLLIGGYKVNQLNAYQRTPLLVAIASGHYDMVMLLLCHGGMEDPRGNTTAVHCAVRFNQLEIMQALLANGYEGDTINADRDTPLHLALRREHRTIAKELLYEFMYGGGTEFHWAAFWGHVSVIQLLLDNKRFARPRDTTGATPLLTALKHRQIGAAMLLAPYGGLEDPDDEGMTAMHIASEMNLPQFTELLIAKGCNPNLPCQAGRVPLRYAVDSRSTAVVLMLLASGCDPSAADAIMVTPLHVAVESEYVAAVQMIVDNGGDPDLKDAAGRAPKSLCKGLCTERHLI